MLRFFLLSGLNLNFRKCGFLSLGKKDSGECGWAEVVLGTCPREVFQREVHSAPASSCQPRALARGPENPLLQTDLCLLQQDGVAFNSSFGFGVLCWPHSLLTSVLCPWLTLLCPFLREALPGPPPAPSGLPLPLSSFPQQSSYRG